MSRIKNFVLKAITYFAGAVCLLSALSLDSPTWVPTITMCISGAWLVLYGIANNWFEV